MSKLGTIKQIEETSFPPLRDGDYSYGQQDGFMITTDTTTVWLGIGNSQNCCEDWGYLMSEDDLDEFIGASLHSVEVTDDELGTNEVRATYDGGAMFVNLATSMGVLQFKAYNAHNGYYGHTASVIIGEETAHEECL